MPNAASNPESAIDGHLLARCLESDGPARTILLEQICAEHPERAASLRRLYGLLDEFGLADEPAIEAEDGTTRLALPDQIGPYRVIDLLGSGGMGIVYRAQHRELGRQVALKVIHGPLARTEKARARFRREATLAARLDDPRICPVYEIGEASDGTPYLAMRHVPGETLAHSIARSRIGGHATVTLSSGGDRGNEIPKLLQFVEQIAHALHKAHETGLVHRDVKPGNVMVTPDGAPVLLDFGLAASDDDDATLTRTGDQLGTPHYMAPEQITAGAIDRRTDVYALGVVLYESLTGRPPFSAPRRHDLASQILSAAVPDPRRNHRAIGRELWTVLQTALAKDPARRYATAAAFADDLRRVRCREPILARRPGVLRRLVQFAQRHPFAATLLGVLSAAVVVFALLIEQREATAAALRATANARTAPAAALPGAVAAVRRHRSVETLSALQEVVVTHHERLRLVHGGATWTAFWSRDGERLFTTSDDGMCRVFDRSGTQHTRIAHNLRPVPGARPCVWLEQAPDVAGTLERFVTAADDGSARVLDRYGKELWVLDHRTEQNQTGGTGTFTDFYDPSAYPEVNQARWSSDGARIATSCSDRLVRVWDAATGKKLCELPGHTTPFVKLAWSSTGLLASADDMQNWVADDRRFVVLIWRASGDGYATVQRFVVPDSIHELHWSPDGQSLVGACHDGVAYVWTLGEAEPRQMLHGGPVVSAAFADNHAILTGSMDKSVRLWSRDGCPMHEGRHDAAVTKVAFAGGDAPSGPRRILSTSQDQTVRVWDDALHPLFVLRGHSDVAVHAALSPDGRAVVSTSWDHTVRIWELVDADTPRLVGHRGRVRDLAVLPDGHLLSVADDRTARVWNPATAQSRPFVLPTVPWNVDVAVDGRFMLVGGEDGAVHTFDLRSGAALAKHAGARTQWATGAWLGDGRVAAGVRLRLQVFSGEQEQTWAEDCNAIYGLSLANHRGLLAAAGRRSDVLLRTMAGQAVPGPPLPGHAWARALAWSDDEARLAVGAARLGEVWIWKVPARPGGPWPEPVHLTGHDGDVLDVAWSPNGTLLAVAVGDGSMHLWDMDRGERLVILRGHGNAAVHAVAFASDGLLFSGGADGAIQGWATSVERQIQLASARQTNVRVAGGSANDWAFLVETGRYEEAYGKGMELLDDPVAGRNPKTLAWMAWRLVLVSDEAGGRNPRLLDLAERAAARALDLATRPEGWMLATMARVWRCKDDLAKAVAWQTKAVAATPAYCIHDRRHMEEMLEEYRGLLKQSR